MYSPLKTHSAKPAGLVNHPANLYTQNVCAKTLSAFHSLEQLIGNTPLLAIHLRYKNIKRTIYAKAEYYNFTGSIKDRMALNILKAAYAKGAIKAGDLIAEATSGNAGIAMASIGRALGHPVRIFMPDWMSEERKNLMSSYGAQLQLISKNEGGFLGAIAQSEALQESQENVFLPCQFANQDNSMAHELGTGPEIIQQLASMGLCPDAFVAGVGTGGTIMGVKQAFSKLAPKAKLYPMEPAESPTLSTGYKVGSHRIQGVSDEFIPSIVKLNSLDEVISVNDGDGIIMAQKLASELGIGVGISSGANLLASLKVHDKLGVNAIVSTIFCDDNKKYLSTDLCKKEVPKSHYLSQEVELLGFETIRGL
jgi:cysteine synthase A